MWNYFEKCFYFTKNRLAFGVCPWRTPKGVLGDAESFDTLLFNEKNSTTLDAKH